MNCIAKAVKKEKKTLNLHTVVGIFILAPEKFCHFEFLQISKFPKIPNFVNESAAFN